MRAGPGAGTADVSRGRRRDDVPGVESVLVSLAVEEFACVDASLRRPSERRGRLAVARQLQEFVCDPEELAWLVREAPLRYPAWPGIREIRALYCGRFSPRDGVVVASRVYEDGIIPGVVDPPHLIADGRHGALISANPGDALMVRMLADAMPPPAAPRKPPKSATPKPKLPTQEEIDRIKEEQRQNQKRDKAGGEPPGDEA